jgi:mRNA-degrading endonuclease toxin of MazEF toxin-antitoxin module
MKQNPCIRRGGCYWVENLNAVGHEMMKTRPAVVVSCGALAGTSPVVNIVYLSNAIPAVPQESKAPDTAAVERDIYRRLYEGLLDRMRMDRRETA